MRGSSESSDMTESRKNSHDRVIEKIVTVFERKEVDVLDAVLRDMI